MHNIYLFVTVKVSLIFINRPNVLKQDLDGVRGGGYMALVGIGFYAEDRQKKMNNYHVLS